MIRIGIADDDPLVRRTLAQLLSTEEGISVAWTAQDGQEALDLIHSTETEPVQAVLLDVQMPRLDGLTLAKTLHEENPELAIIILSTLIADSISNEAFAAGVRGFVAKEDDVDALAGAIKQAVAGNIVLTPKSSAVLSDRLQPASADRGSTPPALLQQKRGLPPPLRCHPVRPRAGGPGTHQRGPDQQADRQPVEPERGHHQVARVRHHRQARCPGPGRSRRLRHAARPGQLSAASDPDEPAGPSAPSALLETRSPPID